MDASRAEFCENGAKAVAEEATVIAVPLRSALRRSCPRFPNIAVFQQGWLPARFVLRPVMTTTAHQMLSADRRAAQRGLTVPTAVLIISAPATKRRSPQQLPCAFGTNTCPRDCSNMCHVSLRVRR